MTDVFVWPAARQRREEMSRLVAEHYSAVYRFCARRVGPDLAQDAAQETFLTAQRRLGSFDQRSAASTWLFGIANNHCRNLARKRRFEISFTDCWRQPEPQEELNLADRSALREAILALSQEHREVVVMHEIEGLGYEEAAKILGIPVGTVKSRLHYAFQQLQRSLNPKETTQP